MNFFKRLLSLGPQLAAGLDIGSSAIKLVELRQVEGKYHLQRLGIEPLSPEAIVNGAIMDSSLVVDALHRLIDQTHLKNTACATSLSGHSVIIKKISLPAMTIEELDASIQWEAEQYIPFDVNDVRLDYWVLEGGEPGRQNMEVVIVAIKRDKVNDYMSVISRAGKYPAIVDVDAFAVQNAYELNYDLDPREVVALINMGAAVTNINILARGTTVFWRDISLGGNQFTEALQRELTLPFVQAEGLKQGENATWHTPADAQPLLDQVSLEMASEIRKTFDFFMATSAEGPVDRIVLSGGCALTANLRQVLSDRLKLPAELMNPLRLIHYRESDFDADWLRTVAPMMAVAVGLAIRRVQEEAARPPVRRRVPPLQSIPLDHSEGGSGVTMPRASLGITNSAGESPPSSAPIPPTARRALDLPTKLTHRVEEKSRSEAVPPVGRKKDPASEAKPAPAPDQSGKLTVFISYAREDSAFARKVCDELKAAGLDVWLDQERLLPGQRWKPTIKKAIQESDCFIALLSSTALSRRGYIHTELWQALEILQQMPGPDVFLIPARLDDCEPAHPALEEIHWVDLFPDWSKGMEKILSALKTRKSL